MPTNRLYRADKSASLYPVLTWGRVASVVRAGAAIVAAAGALTAQADVVPNSSKLSDVIITPKVADVNVFREIAVSGTWPHACGPTGATLVTTDTDTSSTIVVRLAVPQTLVACAQVLTKYSVSVGYTPKARGRLRVVVVTNDGEFLGESSLETRAADDNRSLYDITGVWYDPATNGSGLTFIQSRANDNGVFGTWYVYDTQGKARWYSIQNVQWKSQGKVLEGAIYETQGKSVSCPAPFNACPVEFSSATAIGTARITMNSADSAVVQALGANGNVLFSSNVSRVGL